MTYEYIGAPWIEYDEGGIFVRVCSKCGRFVKADETIRFREHDADGPIFLPNATCSKCGRTHMQFVGFI